MSKNTVYVRVLGGIGNQLFIYAFARSLALQNNYEVFLDMKTGFLNDNYGRTPKLAKYIRNISTASHKSNILFYFTKMFPNLSQFFFKTKILIEPESRVFFDVHAELLKEEYHYSFIQGYFQSYLYFEQFTQQIKDDIKLDFLKTSLINRIAAQIMSSQAVSIHVRRIAYDNLLDLAYYTKAINLIYENIESPIFFVFSDDIDWCKKNFPKKASFVFITHDMEDEIADLWLMTLCKHHIIANSSFSWWGAWLSQNNDKIVVAPSNTQIGVIGNTYPNNWVDI